jgi:hypothetical protein
MRKTKCHRWISLLALTSVSLLALWSAFLCYALVYYHGNAEAYSFLKNQETVTVVEEKRGYAFLPKKATKKGAVFYGGGKVESAAYAPLCAKLAEQGYKVFLPRLPYHFAFFEINAVDRYLSSHEEITSWYVFGHSLGGAMLGEYASSHYAQLKGIAFLGAYSEKNLSKTPLECATIYGSNDGVLNRQKYQENLKNLPENYREKIIEGGNHASFGDYGKQTGDGLSEITNLEQIEATVQFLLTVWN